MAEAPISPTARTLPDRGSTPTHVLVLGESSPELIQDLSDYCETEYLPHAQPSPQAIARAHIVIVRSHVPIDSQFLDAAANLGLLIRAGGGLDNIDTVAVAERSIQFRHLGTRHSSRSVAELALGSTLYLLRRIGLTHAGIARGEWLKPKLLGSELHHRNVGVWGYGPVGQSTATLFASLGAQVRVHNRTGNTEPFQHEPSLAALAEWAQVHVVALPSSSATSGLISNALLEAMARQRPILNIIGRTNVVNVDLVVAALRRGTLTGLAIDPIQPSDLSSLCAIAQDISLNLVITPHIGANTQEALGRMGQEISRVVHSYVLSRSLPDQ